MTLIIPAARIKDEMSVPRNQTFRQFFKTASSKKERPTTLE